MGACQGKQQRANAPSTTNGTSNGTSEQPAGQPNAASSAANDTASANATGANANNTTGNNQGTSTTPGSGGTAGGNAGGNAGTSGGNNSPSNRSGNRRNRDVRVAPVKKSLIAVENDKIKLTKEPTGNYTLAIDFETASSGFEISAKFNAHVANPSEHNVIPTVTGKPGQEYRKTVQSEQKVAFEDIPESILKVLASAEDNIDLPNEIPLVIHFRSTSEDYKSNNVTALWLYCNLKQNESNWDVLVLKKLVARDGRAYLMQTLFGGTITLPGTEGDGQECVVCLSAPREVVVLHCKHVCLCRACASVTSSTWSYQCPICRGRVAAFVAVEGAGG